MTGLKCPRSLRGYIAQTAVILLFWVQTALGQQLILTGLQELHLEGRPDNQKLTGSYSIRNVGTQQVLNTYPSLEVEGAIWSGEGRTLRPGETYVWKVELEVSPISRPDDPATIELPVQGMIPILATRLYQDNNGYQFSAKDVFFLPSAAVPTAVLYKIRVPEVAPKMSIASSGDSFSGTVEVRNVSSHPLRLGPRYWVGSELEMDPLPAELSLKPFETKTLAITGRNYSATPGSKYPIAVLFQWADDGVRYATAVSAMVDISLPDHALQLRRLAACIALCGLCLAILIIRMRCRDHGRGPEKETLVRQNA